jgi:two-component system, cell cycle response regulator
MLCSRLCNKGEWTIRGIIKRVPRDGSRQGINLPPGPANGMAANDQHLKRSGPLPPAGAVVCLSAKALQERLEEEINRAGRHGTPLSCLVVVIENLDELSKTHGSELSEQTLVYVGEALRRELRRFDRVGRPSEGELAVLLPGADGPRGEIVARRALARLRSIKVEADGERRPLRVSVGLAAWREDVGGEELLAQTRAAARNQENGLEPVQT